MSLSERLKKILATEEVEEEVDEEVKGEAVEKAAKADKPADKKVSKPKKLVWKQITLGARPININLEKEVERFNK